jgi:dimethylhistidine N-methyltransferase
MTVQTLPFGTETTLRLCDYEPGAADFRSAVVGGLSAPRKHLPCKFFYDERGSQLFDQICGLGEYYPTRTEMRIMRRHAGDIAVALGPRCLLIEYGSGSSTKTRVLLDHLADPAGYVPIDISRTHLMRSAGALAAGYPGLTVLPVCSDYTTPFDLPDCGARPASVAAYFPGSTIGNFEPAEAVAFMAGVRRQCGHGSGLLIGVDLKKDPAVLHAAYNDAAGVTAAFNLNLLRRINAELDGTFDLAAFHHYAHYNPDLGRVEMHLISGRAQDARVGASVFSFDHGESIHTESCYKYTTEEFGELAAAAGYRVASVWLDDRKWFSVQHLVSA